MHKDYDITLHEAMLMLPPKQHKNNNDDFTLKGFMTGGVDLSTPAKLAAFVANYEATPAARRLRERMTEDVAVASNRTRPRRVAHRQYGERVGDVQEYERFKSGKTRDQRFWEGRTRVEHRRTGTLVMHCNIGLHAGEPQSNLEWSGACALALTDLLESMGYRVELWATMTTLDHTDGRLSVRVAIKQANERMTTQATALISHGGVFRACFFTHMRSLEDFRVSPYLGRPADYEGKQEAAITVPQSICNEIQAVRYIEQTMKQYAEGRQ